MSERSGECSASGLNSTKNFMYMGIAVQDTSLIHYYALFVMMYVKARCLEIKVLSE